MSDTYTTTTGEVWSSTADGIRDENRLTVSTGEILAELHALRAQRDELLAALQKVVGWTALARLLDRGIAASVDGDPCWAEARAAIARATGKQEAQR